MFSNIVKEYDKEHHKLTEEKAIYIQRIKAMNLKQTNDILQKFNDVIYSNVLNQGSQFLK